MREPLQFIIKSILLLTKNDFRHDTSGWRKVAFVGKITMEEIINVGSLAIDVLMW